MISTGFGLCARGGMISACAIIGGEGGVWAAGGLTDVVGADGAVVVPGDCGASLACIRA